MSEWNDLMFGPYYKCNQLVISVCMNFLLSSRSAHSIPFHVNKPVLFITLSWEGNILCWDSSPMNLVSQ